ncbi:MAG: SDR family oxidoreductase [Clostridia bacterium]|nr:SDR family oxidoreductase [Clostridia bacterium]
MESRIIAVTGSSKGIGYALAECFLKKGQKVALMGTSQKSVDEAADKLKAYSDSILPLVCDVRNAASIGEAIKSIDEKYGRIDIWINNAGVNHQSESIFALADSDIKNVVDVNVYGVVNGSRAAGEYMKKQGSGAIYNMEGLGSDGRIAKGSAYYGMTKRMVRYFTRCLAKELDGTGVIAGRLSPGMVLTKLLLKDVETSPEKESTLKIFKILADKADVVAEFLSDKILKNSKNGAYIAWLTTGKILWRFMTAPITKRDPMK